MTKPVSVTRSLITGRQDAVAWKDWPEGATTLVVEPDMEGRRIQVTIDGNGVPRFQGQLSANPVVAAIRATGVREVMFDGVLTARCTRFYAFDCVPLDIATEQRRKPGGRKWLDAVPVPLSERYGMLGDLVAKAGRPALTLMPQFEAYSPTQVFALLDEMLDLEFAGAIAKDPDSPYYYGQVQSWQKMSPMETIAVTITKAIAGRNKHKGRLGALEGCNKVGATTTVAAGFPNEMRERLWSAWDQAPETLIGKTMEVKCRVGDTSSGCFLRFRCFTNPVLRDA